jgi:putative autoinducer-2 (AI-2) aldolase
MTRDARYFSLASRIAAEMGAQFVKTYFVEEGLKKSPPAARCRL